jgi:hypothetical protein
VRQHHAVLHHRIAADRRIPGQQCGALSLKRSATKLTSLPSSAT